MTSWKWLKTLLEKEGGKQLSNILQIKFTYTVGNENTPESYQIIDEATNVKKEMIGEILGEYIQSIVCSGIDDSTPNIKDVYEITIQCDLDGDRFSMKSDCGNKGLAAGIVMRVARMAETLAIALRLSKGSEFA